MDGISANRLDTPMLFRNVIHLSDPLKQFNQTRRQRMAALSEEVQFLPSNTKNCSQKELQRLNQELLAALGNLEPASAAYMERALAFHEEVAERRLRNL